MLTDNAADRIYSQMSVVQKNTVTFFQRYRTDFVDFNYHFSKILNHPGYVHYN